MIVFRLITLPFSHQTFGMEEIDEIGKQNVRLNLWVFKIPHLADVAHNDFSVFTSIEERIDWAFTLQSIVCHWR